MIKLGCADYTWPMLTHEAVLEHVKGLGVEGIDLGLFGNRSHLRPEVVRLDPAMWAGRIGERLDRVGLALSDVFFIPWTNIQRLAANHPRY